MTDNGHQLTVRVRMQPTAADRAAGEVQYRYRWGRIALAVAALLAVLWILARVIFDTPGLSPGGGPAGGDPAMPGSQEAGLVADAATTPQDQSAAADAVEAEPQAADAPAADATVADSEAADKAADSRRSDDSESESAPDSLPVAAAPSAAGERSTATVSPDAGPDQPAAQVKAPSTTAATPSPPATPAAEEGLSSDATPAVSPAPRAAADNAASGAILAAGETRILSERVARFRLTNAVRDREPVAGLEAVKIDNPSTGTLGVYAFSEVRGLAGRTVIYRWLQGDRITAQVRVAVGSDKWRSSSSKVINNRMRGPWRVELTTAEGELLAFAEFVY